MFTQPQKAAHQEIVNKGWCIYYTTIFSGEASLEAIDVRERKKRQIKIYTNRTNDFHTHRGTTGTQHGAYTETNFGHHTVPVGLIIECIRSQFVL